MVTATQTIDVHGQHPLLGASDGYLTLRVRGSEHDGRVLHIHSPKCVIGSDPGCTLRLCADGVRPVHCLILRGTEGMFVRRWSPDTCLNGGRFDVARLHPGDCLAVGPIELEVLPGASVAPPDLPIQPPADPEPAPPSAAIAAQETQQREADLEAARQELARIQGLVEQQQQELSAAHGRAAAAESQVGKLEAAIAELETRMTAAVPPEVDSAAASDEIAAELAAAHDLAQQLGEDLQRQKEAQEEYERARDQWQKDREQLEGQLAECTAVTGDLKRRCDQYMEEAEVLMLAMQQEGKHMLIELEEAREKLRENGGRHKKPTPLANTVRFLLGNPDSTNARSQDPSKHDLQVDRTVVTPLEPTTPDPHRPSACPTMLMSVPTPDDDLPVAATSDMRGPAESLPRDAAAVAGESSEEMRETERRGTTDLELEEPRPPVDPPPPPSRVVMAASDPTGEHDSGDDDGVIERYMERLLRRVAKIPDEVETPPQMVAALQARVTAPRPALASIAEPAPRAEPSSSTEPPAESTTAASAPVSAPTRGGTPGELARRDNPSAQAEAVINRILRPREGMPQVAADLLAMRELANRTARHAVDRHDYRRGTVAAAGQCTVACVCLVSGAMVAALSQKLFSAAMIGGTLGFSFGFIFLVRGLATFHKLWRLKRDVDGKAAS